MSWQDQLQQASFRGVQFQVDSSTNWIGRDKIVRTYPFRDFPTIQDVGGVSEPGQFSAYVFGETAFEQRDSLMRALNTPGPGQLVHPWFGPMLVEIIGKVGVRHSTQEGGVVRFDITYILANDTTYPQATENTSSTTQDAVDTARSNLAGYFGSAFDATGLPGWASIKTLDVVTGALNAINDTVNSLITKPENFLLFETKFRLFTISLRDVIATPDTLALGTLSLMQDLAGLGDNFTDALARQQTLFDWTADSDGSPYATATRAQLAQNRHAMQFLVRCGAALQAAETIANTDFTTTWNYVDAMAWRNTMNQTFQALLLDADSSMFQCLLDVMTALSNDLVTRANYLGRVSTTSTGGNYQAAVYVSYQRYGVIDYADEIVLNNNIANPLFIPPATQLELVSHDK